MYSLVYGNNLPHFLFIPKLILNNSRNFMSYNFEVYQNDKIIFYSDGHWLHPIFEFEQFLEQTSLYPDLLKIKDKIIGRAAALLLVRLGIRKIHARLLSELGKDVLEHFDAQFTYEELVPQIGCQTEDLLKKEYDPETAHRLILTRIQNRKNDLV